MKGIWNYLIFIDFIDKGCDLGYLVKNYEREVYIFVLVVIFLRLFLLLVDFMSVVNIMERIRIFNGWLISVF